MTVNEIIKEFNRITGDSNMLVLASNYIRSRTTKRGKEHIEIVGFCRKNLEKSPDLRQWFSDWYDNNYRINSRLGLRLFNLSMWNSAIWIGETSQLEIDNAKKQGENNGHSVERVCTAFHTADRHGTLQEDKKQKIDIWLKVNGRLTKCQVKCSISNSSVNI